MPWLTQRRRRRQQAAGVISCGGEYDLPEFAVAQPVHAHQARIGWRQRLEKTGYQEMVQSRRLAVEGPDLELAESSLMHFVDELLFFVYADVSEILQRIEETMFLQNSTTEGRKQSRIHVVARLVQAYQRIQRRLGNRHALANHLESRIDLAGIRLTLLTEL